MDAFAGRDARGLVLRHRLGVSLERWIAVVRLGLIPFLLVRLVLIPPAVPAGMLLVAGVLAVTSVVVLSLYMGRPALLADDRLRIAVFAIDCVAFAAAMASYAGPGDLTWATYILVLLSAAIRWDVRGAAAAMVVFLLADLSLDLGTPAYSHLTVQSGAIAVKIGLIALLALYFGLQFRSFSRVSREYEAQAEALRQQTQTVRRSEALQGLQLGVTRALSEARTLEEAVPKVLEELGSRLDHVLAQWWEADPAADVLRWKESWLAPGVAAVDFIRASQDRTFPSGAGLPGRTWAAGQVVVVEDVALDPDFPRAQGATQAGLRGAVAFPVLNGLEVTAVLELFATAPGAPTDETRRALAAIGSQVGQFVERRRAETALRAAGERITAVLENVADGIITMDAEGRVQSLNAAARRLFGYRQEDVIGSSVEALVPENDREHLLQRLLSHSAAARPRSDIGGALETVGRRMDGSTFPLELRSTEMIFVGQRIFVVSLRDISERKAQTEALQYQAMHDALTGLPNRTLMGDRLRHAIASAARDHQPLALLLLDLDRFKEVNDTMGHPYGDLILQQVASRIRDLLREADTVARLGGDEFAVLPSGTTAPSGAIRTAQKLVRAFEKPFVIDDRAFDIRASIGIALYPQHGDDAETLMRRADVAMYVAKRGKKPYQLYEASHDVDTELRVALMGELRQAPGRQEMILMYQPKIDLGTGEVVAVEALLRWAHPDRGTLMPDQFVAYAEQTEIINSITRWVLDTALNQVREWCDAGVELAVAINMSARNLHDPELPNLVARLLTTWNVPAELLIVEITESVAMDGAAEETLQQLAALGVRLSIDDFGTGYSSLAYLKRLPIEELKIDRSFVSAMDTNPDDAAIVRPTIDLGHNLGLRVVAEGVENEAALQMLRSYGCDLAQGYLISPPRDASDLITWLSSYRVGGARPAHVPTLRTVEGTET